MNTCYNTFTAYIPPLFKTNRLSELTLQQKKILIIASCALCLLTTLYLAKKHGSQLELSKKKCVAYKEPDIIKDSLIRLENLNSLPKEKILNTSEGVFHNPHATMLDINKFLEPFMKKYGYPGASFSMSTNQIYGKTLSGQWFTSVYFRKKDSLYNHVQDYFHSLFKTADELEMRKKELKNDVSSMIDKWGYDSIQIGNVDKEFFPEGIKSDYDLYLLLFFKKDGKALSIPDEG